MNNGKHKFKLFQPVLLDYTEDDLLSEDLGMSGIVLHSPFKDFAHLSFLKETYLYRGTIKENPDRCVIARRTLNGDFGGRDWVVGKSMIKPHPDYEFLDDEWVIKY
jgi:hypothetical protein